MKAERCQQRFWKYDPLRTQEESTKTYAESRQCKRLTHWSMPPGIFEHLQWFCWQHRPGLSKDRTRERKEMAQVHASR